VFEYLDAEGEDQSAHAFGMLTPIAMSSGLQVNTAPTEDEPSIPWQPGIDRLAEIFPHVQSLAPFDFVRLDYVDHVFDSVVEGTDDIPLSDRLTPAAIRQVIQTAKAESSCIGAMAERMGYDLEPYAEVGFDLILGADILRPIDPDFLTDMLKFQSEIEDLNAKRQVPVSIQYAIDTHDTGHPQIDSVPAKLGRKSVLLRILLAGLGCAGLGRRPMYEVMGNQDMTVGLYQANNRPVSLEWRNDLEFYQSQLRVRAFLDTFRPLLSASSIRETQIGLAWVLWCIDRLDGIRQRLVCICRPESGTLDKDARDIQVYPFNQYWFDEARVEEYDIATGTSSFVPIEVDGTIALGRMSRGSFRVFLIRENGQDMNGVWV
jgi:hypothetical protein